MASTSTAQVASAVNNFYDRTLLIRALPYFLHVRMGQVRDLPANNSLVIKFRKYASLTAATTALTEGVTPTGSQLSVTDVSATVAQYGDFVTLTDVLQFSTLDPLLTETAELLGEQAGDTLDQLTRNVVAAGSTVQYASTATGRTSVATGMILNGDEIREMVRTLKGGNAKKLTKLVNPSAAYGTSPIRPAFIGIISEDTEYDLKKDPDYVPIEEYASQADVMEGECGKIDEVRFVCATTNAKVFAAGGAGSIDVHATLIFGADAFGVSRISGEAMKTITKPLGSAGTADPLDQRSTMGWKATFVAKILQDAFLGRIEHAVSA